MISLHSHLYLVKCFDEAVDTKSCCKVIDIIAWYLSESTTLWAGDGCVEAA